MSFRSLLLNVKIVLILILLQFYIEFTLISFLAVPDIFGQLVIMKIDFYFFYKHERCYRGIIEFIPRKWGQLQEPMISTWYNNDVPN